MSKSERWASCNNDAHDFFDARLTELESMLDAERARAEILEQQIRVMREQERPDTLREAYRTAAEKVHVRSDPREGHINTFETCDHRDCRKARDVLGIYDDKE